MIHFWQMASMSLIAMRVEDWEVARTQVLAAEIELVLNCLMVNQYVARAWNVKIEAAHKEKQLNHSILKTLFEMVPISNLLTKMLLQVEIEIHWMITPIEMDVVEQKGLMRVCWSCARNVMEEMRNQMKLDDEMTTAANPMIPKRNESNLIEAYHYHERS
jgi:hypothetical protein